LVESHREVQSVVGEVVTYEHHLRYGGSKRVNSNRIRFMPHEKLARFLGDAGFTDIAWYGDWDRTPIASSKPELIVVAA
jgi:hypothetical protein